MERSLAAGGSRLRRLARQAIAEREQQLQQCDLCGEPIPSEHRHLLDLESREVMCSCRACSLLFDRRAAGGAHYRLIGDRRLCLADFELDDPLWAQLCIPVEMAFFFESSLAGRVVAFYPSPLGATESQLGLGAWEQLAGANPVLDSMTADVEALLVNRARGAEDHYLVPIDDCYRLVAVIRTRWRGLSGGKEVREEIERFFARLRDRSRTVDKTGKEIVWQT